MPDSPDLDNTVPPLSVSVMNALEDMVLNNDPDYVQPQPEAIPGTRKGKARPLNLVTVTVTGGKVRSSAPIWNFFDVSEKIVNGRMEKGAVCKVDRAGVPCGKK